jgi:hypothetical protein
MTVEGFSRPEVDTNATFRSTPSTVEVSIRHLGPAPEDS